MMDLLPSMDQYTSVAAAIIDWIDPDEDVTTDAITGEEGSESTYYEGLDPPYHAKNLPLESVDELRLVAGVDDGLLYGADTNHNGVVDPDESANADASLNFETSMLGITPLVCRLRRQGHQSRPDARHQRDLDHHHHDNDHQHQHPCRLLQRYGGLPGCHGQSPGGCEFQADDATSNSASAIHRRPTRQRHPHRHHCSHKTHDRSRRRPQHPSARRPVAPPPQAPSPASGTGPSPPN